MKYIFLGKDCCLSQENIISLGMQNNLFSRSIFCLQYKRVSSDELVLEAKGARARKDGSLPKITKGSSYFSVFPEMSAKALGIVDNSLDAMNLQSFIIPLLSGKSIHIEQGPVLPFSGRSDILHSESVSTVKVNPWIWCGGSWNTD